MPFSVKKGIRSQQARTKGKSKPARRKERLTVVVLDGVGLGGVGGREGSLNGGQGSGDGGGTRRGGKGERGGGESEHVERGKRKEGEGARWSGLRSRRR